MKTRLLDKAIETRRELFFFVGLVSVWGVVLGAFGNALYAFAKLWLYQWTLAHPAVAFGMGILLFLVLTGLGAFLLAQWVGGTDQRSFKLVLPLMAFTERLEALEIDGYYVLGGIRKRLGQVARAGAIESYRESLKLFPGDPFHGELHAKVASAMSGEMIRTVSKTCESLLSDSAAYHGFDFRSLARPAGPCDKVTVEGWPETTIHLPAGCRAKVQQSAPDTEGNSTRELVIYGRFGHIRFSLSPQWAHLSDRYHPKSLALVRNRIKTQVKDYSVCVASQTPTLWPLEVPVEIQAQMASRLFFLISKKSDVYARWIGELLDRVEKRLSWRAYMERSIDVSGEGQT